MKILREHLKNPFYKFIFLAVLCYVIWFIGYDLFLSQQGSLDKFLSSITSDAVVYLMNFSGYKAHYITEFRICHFYNENQRLLQMVPACNGQVLYALFIGFIISSPGLWKDKLKFISAGVLVIFIVNALRVYALCLIKINAPSYLAFNHKYTFTVLVYGCIFVMWMLWINFYVPKALHKSTEAV